MSLRKRQAVIVLGMHRSGTSALAGAIGLMGARLPDRLMPAGPGNPKGYFEPGHIVTIHDRILAAAGTTWAGWERLSAAWMRSGACRPFVDELAAAVLEDYGSAGLFMVKDPRMCRLMPLWFEVLEGLDVQASFVMPFRNPVEVASSVRQREGLPLPHGCVAWLRCVLDAEHQTRGHPRAFLNYTDFVADPRAAMERLLTALPLDWPRPFDKVAAEIRDFVDPSLRHQISDATAIDRMGEHSPWLRQAFGHCMALACADTEAVRVRLDSLRAEFDAADALFTPAFRHDAEAHATEQQAAAAMRQVLSQREQALAGLQRTVSEHAARIASLEHALAAAKRDRAALDRGLAERAARVASLEQALAAAKRGRAALDRALAERAARIASLEQAHAGARMERSALDHGGSERCG